MATTTFDDLLKEATTPGPKYQTPGVVVIAADKTGKITYQNAFGSTAVNNSGTTINADNTFWIASCTKLITTVCVMQCVEKGLLALDDDVSEVLPEWKDPEILTGFDEAGEPILRKATKKMTLRQLLTHSSGMGYEFLSEKLTKWRDWTKDDRKEIEGIMAKSLKMPLLYEPGDAWEYSCSIDWAGQMVERVNGGVRLGEYMRLHIWEPLGMNSTTFNILENENIKNRKCDMTAKSLDTGELTSSPPIRKEDAQDDAGGGGLTSSPNDYMKFLIAVLKNDGTLLKPETMERMFEPQLPDPKYLEGYLQDVRLGPVFRSGVDGEAWNFGLGGTLNMEDVPGVCKKGTMSWGGLPNLFWWIDPSVGKCGLYASQLLPPGDPDSLKLAVAFRKKMFEVAHR